MSHPSIDLRDFSSQTIYVSIRVQQERPVPGSLNLNHEFRTLQPLTMEKTALLLQKFSELCRAIESGKSIEWVEKSAGVR